MGDESRLETLRNLHNKFVEKKIKEEMSSESLETINVVGDIEEIKTDSSSDKLTKREENLMKDWVSTVKCNDRKTYVFGPYRTNVWDHEWSKPFKYYVHEVEKEEETNESCLETDKVEFWDNEIIPLMTLERKTFDSDEEFRSRLNDVSEISNSYHL